MLTVSAHGVTHQAATDLGYILHKHPDRVQEFGLKFGQAVAVGFQDVLLPPEPPGPEAKPHPAIGNVPFRPLQLGSQLAQPPPLLLQPIRLHWEPGPGYLSLDPDKASPQAVHLQLPLLPTGATFLSNDTCTLAAAKQQHRRRGHGAPHLRGRPAGPAAQPQDD